MPTALEIGRARRDIDVMSRAGLPLPQFMDEAAAALQKVVPFVAACLSTLDPATLLLSSTRKYGALVGRNEHDISWAKIEYGEIDPTAMASLVSSGTPAVGMHTATGGDLQQSIRMAALMVPEFDFHDEARAVFRDRTGTWGTISMFRASDDPPFSADEIASVALLAQSFTRGVRTGLLVQQGPSKDTADIGPAVLIVDAADRIAQSSPGARTLLTLLSATPGSGDPLTIVYSLVSAARRFAAGEIDLLPRIRLRAAGGAWLVLHASPLSGSDDRAGDVVVTIEEARPQEVIDLVASAFALTAREREVTDKVLHGADTREIAAAMNVSPYTVQDHLKSVFEKAGVASRRELVARIYFDQYAPRLGGHVGAAGWFIA